MKKLIFHIVILFQFLNLNATHNRAGEITFRQLSDFSYEITIVTYTSSLPGAADRPFLNVDFGDGTNSDVQRMDKVPLPNDYFWNRYIINHTYPGIGTYEVVVEDPNRNYGVNNIPNSVYVVFTIKTILKIDPEIGFNNTPVLLNPPIDRAALNYLFVHNPAAFDPDGDSLTYLLSACLGLDGNPIPGYEFPAASDTLYVEPLSGNLIWDSPMETGSYNVAMNIEEWRNGFKIGNITRDMQIDVYETENKPPANDLLLNFCIEAGDTLEFEFNSFDEDGDSMMHTLLGGPLDFVVFPTDTLQTIINEGGHLKSKFRWVTHWSHIRKYPYSFVVKTEDKNSDISLVDIDNFLVKILAPAPKNVELEPSTNAIFVKWQKSDHENIANYRVYRKTESSDFFDECTEGLPDSLNYVLVSRTKDSAYLDNNQGQGLQFGVQYYYRIVGKYEDGSLSYPSKEVSSELLQGTPQIINTTVNSSSVSNGSISVKWRVPIVDVSEFNGPYRYLISKFNHEESSYQIMDSSLTQITDTLFVDSSINTQDSIHFYKIELLQTEPRIQIGYPSYSSSLFLELIPQNKSIQLNFKKNVPWTNSQYFIYKEIGGIYELLDSTDMLFYVDTGLVNEQEYRYKIKSQGVYEYLGAVFTTLNWSNSQSARPIDTEAPPTPEIAIETSCESYSNRIHWYYDTNANNDISKFKIYYSNLIGEPLQLIDEVGVNEEWTYLHIPEINMGGVYGISAVDIYNNESNPVKITAADSCLYYELPNVFTPNGDRINDTLLPVKMESRFIDEVDFKLYNRTGRKVFETKNPRIEWDGKVNGKSVSSGVYYYVCDLYEKRSVGLIHGAPLTGIIYILMGDEINSD